MEENINFAPEGGWGYVVAFSLSLIYSATTVPLYSFGLVFNDFLNDIGDATYGTTLSNGIYNTILCFTGLFANILLKKFSCRIVGLLGAILFFFGSFSIIYSKTLLQFIITFSIFQGIGFGLLMPSTFTTFNEYFQKRKNFVMAICQAFIVSVTLICPIFTQYLMNLFNWKGTQIIFAGFSLHCIPAVLTFLPIKNNKKKNLDIEKEKDEDENLLKNIKKHVKKDLNTKKSRASLKDLRFINMALGLSCSYTSDFLFISMLPMTVMGLGYDEKDATSMITIYFTFDLICNLFLPVLNYLVTVRNRILFLGGTITSAIFRILLTCHNSYYWIACNIAALGFFRSFIQTPLPLVISEIYGNQFTHAFSLYMVICGITTLIFAPLVGFVSSIWDNNYIAVHTLTIPYFICIIPWCIELIMEKTSSKRIKNQELIEEKDICK